MCSWRTNSRRACKRVLCRHAAPALQRRLVHFSGIVMRVRFGRCFGHMPCHLIRCRLLCSLFSVAYAKLDEESVKVQLRSQFSALCHDETPMVRRAAASNLGKFAKAVSSTIAAATLMQLMQRTVCTAGGARAVAF